MSDLGFAIDDLYASGWWPASSDRCIQFDDGRWYPDESLICQYFAQSIARPKIKPAVSSQTVEVHWYSPASGQQSVLGRSRTEAMILAFTSLYRESLSMQNQL